MAPCVNLVCFWTAGKPFGRWGKMQSLSCHILHVLSEELLSLKFCPQGRKGRRLSSVPSLLLIKCPCVLQQEVLLSWMSGCVERQEARTYGLKNV